MTGSATPAGREFTVYNVPETGQYTINGTFDFDLTLLDLPPQSQSWAFQVWKSGSSGVQLLYEDAKTFIAGDPVSTTLTFTSWVSTGPSNGYFQFTLSNPINSQQLKVRGARTNYWVDNMGGIFPTGSSGGATQTGGDAVFNPWEASAQGVGSGTNPCGLYGQNVNALEIYTDFLGTWTSVSSGSIIQVTPITYVTMSISAVSPAYPAFGGC
jgi:hypothetical protein